MDGGCASREGCEREPGELEEPGEPGEAAIQDTLAGRRGRWDRWHICIRRAVRHMAGTGGRGTEDICDSDNAGQWSAQRYSLSYAGNIAKGRRASMAGWGLQRY